MFLRKFLSVHLFRLQQLQPAIAVDESLRNVIKFIVELTVPANLRRPANIRAGIENEVRKVERKQ